MHRFPGSMAARVQAVCQAVRDDWHDEASAPYGDDGSLMSLADIVDPESLVRVREAKKAAKAAAKATQKTPNTQR